MTNSELAELKAACERIVAAIDLAKLPTFARDINILGLWLDGLGDSERDTALAERDDERDAFDKLLAEWDELRKALNEAITLVGMLSSFAACGEKLDAEDLTRVQKFVDTARLALRDKG